MVVITVIGVEFLVGEIEAGKEFVFFEDEIGDDNFLSIADRGVDFSFSKRFTKNVNCA